MAKPRDTKLNRLERDLPEGLLVDASWLAKRGYSTSLRSQYVAAGWLEQPARGVYRRPRGALGWQQVVISLQMLLDRRLAVGGRTALEAQGYAHYLAQEVKEVHLYDTARPPHWLLKIPAGVRFLWHNSGKLFRALAPALERHADSSSGKGPPLTAAGADDAYDDTYNIERWGQWDWPLVMSAPERALFELLEELPERESFHQVDELMGGLTNLSPARLEALLRDCHNVKVKRLFFFFADRHRHAWLQRIDKQAVDLGKGKRLLVKGGQLDRTYQITVPEDMHGVS